jgi:hypothetical protein
LRTLFVSPFLLFSPLFFSLPFPFILLSADTKNATCALGRLPYSLSTSLPLFTHVTSTRTRTLGICFLLRLFVWGHGIAWEEYLLLFSFFLSLSTWDGMRRAYASGGVERERKLAWQMGWDEMGWVRMAMVCDCWWLTGWTGRQRQIERPFIQYIS